MLRPDTERLWHLLQQQQALAGFLLVGGSALSLQIHHRTSEDLDFAYPGDRLPQARIKALILSMQEKEAHFARSDSVASLEEFEVAGMDLHDYQQDFLVGGVKVSFFALEAAARKLLRNTDALEPVRVASLSEIFKLKALLCADRSKTRDWFDLFVLMRDHQFTMRDFWCAFAEAGEELKRETALDRLCRGIPQRSDEGFEALLQNPPTLEEMRQFFSDLRDRYEVERAAAAFILKEEKKTADGSSAA